MSGRPCNTGAQCKYLPFGAGAPHDSSNVLCSSLFIFDVCQKGEPVLDFFSFVIASFLSFVSCYLSTFKASNKKLISESPLHHVISLVHFHPGPVACKSVNFFFVENGLWSLPLLRTNWGTLFVAGIAQSRSTEYWLIPHRVRCYFTVFVGPTLPNRVFT